MIRPFWRTSLLTTEEEELIEALFIGHDKATRRQNLSSEVLKAAFMGNGGNCNQAVMSAIGTLGGKHAPIIPAYDLLVAAEDYRHWNGKTVLPGWGNSFVKGKRDPTWQDTDFALRKYYPFMIERIDEITQSLNDADKMVFPNAACYTAATALVIGMPRDICPMLVHEARLWTWAELLYDTSRAPSA